MRRRIYNWAKALLAACLLAPALNTSAGFADAGYHPVEPLPALIQPQADFDPDLYHTYDEVVAILQARAEAYDGSPGPGIVALHNLGQTHEGRDIYALKISDNPAANELEEMEILFIGSHHAVELVGVEITLTLMDEIISGYEAQDPTVRAIVDASEIWIVPLLNPDGHRKVEQGLNWRKNTRMYPGQDESNKGVDLNRNYAFRWNNCGVTPLEKTTKCRGNSTDPGSVSYIGPGPFSEQETQAVRNLVNDTSKVDGFAFSLSWHSYGGEILYPWHYTESDPYRNTMDEERFAAGARSIKDAIGQARKARAEPAEGYDIIHPYWRLTAGSSDDWLYGEKGIIAFSIEAYGEEEGNSAPPDGEFNPATREVLDRVIENNLAAAMMLASDGITFRSYLPIIKH